jgi:hypothetical protein
VAAAFVSFRHIYICYIFADFERLNPFFRGKEQRIQQKVDKI